MPVGAKNYKKMVKSCYVNFNVNTQIFTEDDVKNIAVSYFEIDHPELEWKIGEPKLFCSLANSIIFKVVGEAKNKKRIPQ